MAWFGGLSNADYNWLQGWFKILDSQLKALKTGQLVLAERITALEGKVVLVTRELDQLEQALSEEQDVGTAIEMALDNLASQIEGLKNEPALLTKLANDVRARSARLKAAIIRDTQADTNATTTTEEPTTTTEAP
jgi:chromosome segregation ATPase